MIQNNIEREETHGTHGDTQNDLLNTPDLQYPPTPSQSHTEHMETAISDNHRKRNKPTQITDEEATKKKIGKSAADIIDEDNYDSASDEDYDGEIEDSSDNGDEQNDEEPLAEFLLQRPTKTQRKHIIKDLRHTLNKPRFKTRTWAKNTAYEVMHDMFPGGSSEDDVKKVRDFIQTISKRNMTQTELDHIEAWFASQRGGEHCWGVQEQKYSWSVTKTTPPCVR